MSKPPRIPDSGNTLGPITAEFDSLSLLKGLHLIDHNSPAGSGDPNVAGHGDAGQPGASLTGEASSDDNGLAAETSTLSDSNGAEQAAVKIGDLISTRGITPTWAGDGGLKLTGLAEATARIGIHLDGAVLETQTANGFGSLQRVGLADSAHTATDAAAGTGTTATATTLTVNSALGADPIFETRVAAAGDDVEEKGSGTISSNINDLELGYDGTTRQTVGIRFTGVDIPKGAIITTAYIQFQANEVKTGATSLLIQGDNVDDASAFTSTAFNVSSLPRTTASTAWTPDPWTVVGEHDLAERTPDLTAIIQEIVNRSGWAALNHMAFLITGTGTRTADSYEYNPASAPLLHVEYLLPGPAGSPVAFNTPPDADPAANQIAELAAAGTAIGITASASDPDAGSTVAYSVNDTRFAIDSSGVITRSGTGTLDFETQSSINLTVTATSSDGSTANQSYTLAILDSPEPVAFNTPPDADSAANQIAQSAAAGTAVGITASAKDPDAGSTVAYSISDTRFAINSTTGVITRSGTGTLNATTEPTVNLTVTATSSDGSTDTHAFSIAVTGNSNTTPVTFETRIATAGDDAEQKSSGAMSTNVSDLELGYDGNTAQTDGLRFTGINIPQGAIITNAYIQFQANEVKTGATSLLIQGDNVDDASAFTNVKYNVSSLPRTTASIAWTPDPWTVVGEHGLAERTPDLTAIVQEIVNRSGWAALNHMAFLITGTGTRTADSYEYNPASAPLLHVEYLLPGPAGSPVAFNTPPDADPAANQIAELAAAGTAIGITASASDPDAGSTVTYSVNDTRFTIDSSGVITRSSTGTLDFETQTSINLTVTATSSDGSTANQSYTLAVLDSPEPVAFNTPPDADSAANQITQSAAAGTAVGITASAKDPDAGSTVAYSISDTRFAINSTTGVITRSGTGTLNAATEPTVNLHVTATSSDGSTATQDYAVSVTAGPTFERRIATSADDVEQGPTGGMDLTSTNLDMVIEGTKNQTVGMRFTSVDIPYDAVITSAYIQFQAQNTSTGAVSLLLRGESDEATPFEVETNDVTSRLMTNASVTWTPPDWTVNNEAGLAERTPDLSAIVQEIINQPGYLQLNDMAFVVSGSSGIRRANSFDGSPTGAPLLHIEYYVPTTGPVGFKHPQDADSAANQITDRATAGTLVHITASAKDPDVTDKVTYSINDSRFAIDANTGVITRSGTGTLNAATEPSINLHVTATSSDGSTAGQDYTLSVVPTTAPQVLYRYAVFGDYGDTDLSGEKAVSAMVHAWNVDFILTIGDNVYAPQVLDAAVGQQYHDYIGNYQGAYGSGSAINRFFPTLGNHEYNEGNVDNYLNYFTLPDNERYYDFQIGPVHFFALNSNKQEPDGRSYTSVQGHWMQNLLANSDATFNVAYFHHTPYNPSGYTATMRWPFEQWGVNAVFAGHEHNYYRENRDDNGDGVYLPYTTTGLGGSGKTVPNVGANLVTVTDQGMLIEFYKVSSFDGTTATPVLTDSYFVPTPASRTPTIVNGGYVLNGTTGADYLWGLGGNDTLIGGRGNDLLVAGNQHNLFVFHKGDGQDTVMNFVAGAGTGDVLDLRDFGINNASQFQQVATNQGSNVVATLGGGDQITITGVHVDQFQDDNFLSSLLLA